MINEAIVVDYLDKRIEALRASISFYKDYADSIGENSDHAAQAHAKIAAMHEIIREINSISGFIITCNRAQS